MKKLQIFIIPLTSFLVLTAGCAKKEKYAGEWRDICIKNLKEIESNKEWWGLETKQAPTAVPSVEQVQSYFKDKQLPKCPAGGAYTLNSLEQRPECSISSHK